ncbi:hypothetical protein ACOBQJ_13235 [Pelotomaculum propionicicum]|uniref:hypothetical protein n=1 Tax=Pelotomaculum propionicicum TaxID=258475 RepID=UPI003B7881CC
MNESQNTKQRRITLYEEVWSEPVTTVAERYGVSDNGLRKRCKALNIPLPPVGYWAKVRAGKPVADRPPLPPYDETILSYESYEYELDIPKVQKQKRAGRLELLDLDELTVEQLTNMHDFDMLAPGSLDVLTDWCNGLTVPGRIQDYDVLISKHKSEMEYRKERDKEHPFKDDGITLWRPFEKVKYRSNEAVIPITVSDRQINRAYRIVDTILKAFCQLKCSFSVDRGDRDNISITLLSTVVSFNVSECKTKRRHLIDSNKLQDLRPLYEEVYDGRLQINWQIRKSGYYYGSDKTHFIYLNFIDRSNNLLENQISAMILEVYKHCCNNEISNVLEHKKRTLKFEQEKNEQLATELAKKLQKREEEKRARKEILINDLYKHSKNWFKRERLLRYADELENYLITYEKTEKVGLLQEYIRLVRENAEKYNPISQIIETMYAIELQEDD